MTERIDINFDKYYLYAELTAYLEQYAAKYPQFIRLESMGKSFEQRDVWVTTVTNFATGSPDSKPAMYVDGNIHAGEVTGSVACLYLIDYLLSGYGNDASITKLLDSRTFYIVPRVNPDGAEKYLTTPVMLRSSVRPFPDHRKDEDPPGLHAEDVDGDGRILYMRLRDDKRGAWKIDSTDARLMVQRSPLDIEGPFYHIYTEGVLRDAQGNLVEKPQQPFAVAATKFGLDLNRNFPSGFSPLTNGAGPFPLSEPETRNQVEFIAQHKNIAGVLLYHTTGGVLFRPHSTIPDKDFAREDLAMYEAIGKLGTDATGYPVVCCYGDIFSGVLDDWCFDQLGLLAFTPELWNAEARAVPEIKGDILKRMSGTEKRSFDLKMLEWNDRELCGEGFVNWHEVQHPQFGAVEIGGWKAKECRQNPPTHMLKPECHKITGFTLAYALALPEVHIDEVAVEKVAEGMYSVHALVSNHGFLSTNVTMQAIKQKAVRPDIVSITLPDSAELVNSEYQYEIGHLEGYSVAQQGWMYWTSPPQKGIARVKWNIKAQESTKATITLKSQRGGTESQEVIMK